MTKAQIVALLEGKCLVDTNEKLIHTCEGTFSVVKKKSFGPPNNPANDNRPNRAQTLWKMSRHVIIEDIVTDDLVWEGHAATKSEKDQVLETWRLVTSKDPDRPNKKQSLYFTQDGAEYCRYDADANLTRSGTLDQLIDDCGYITSISIEAKFRLWLPKNGVAQDKADGYVRHLKAISESPAPHTATGAWDGFYYDLIGNHPSRKVFEISSLCEFDVVYSELRRFFDQSAPDSAGYNAANYQQCYDYSHDSRGGDQRTMLNGFKKYREFLGGLARFDVLAAIRTKPFILLAGISGTGKSRLVRQLARGCCPKEKPEGGDHPLYDEGKPGNFEMIQVRPNWHDSTELMGYVSRIVKAGDPPKYVMMPFVEFLAKAWVYREVPFFLCLDEMNLAPVEQYFAEYLSVIETREKRTLGSDGATFEAISTDQLVRWESLEKDTLKNAVKELFEEKEWAAKDEHGRVEEVEKLILHDKGIRVPPNLVVMGTVNMDETTCSFSRKVLDRAMSFELNDVADMYDPAKLAAETECEFGTIQATEAEAKLLTGKDAYDSTSGQAVAIAADGTKVGDAILKILERLNEKEAPAKKDDGSDDGGTMSLLAKTPFKIAYRTRNEIMIYCVERIGKGLVMLPQALDEAISMKILSRIEGDSQHVQKKWLITLSAAIESELSRLDGYDAAKCTLCKTKLADMAEQADYGYTSFWTR